VGLDGTQKMSKSLGNHIGVSEEPKAMYGKTMSISDDLMIQFYNLLTSVRGSEIFERVKSGALHPKTAKEDLAEQLTACFCGSGPAQEARREFNSVFSNRQNPTDIPLTRLSAGSHPIAKVITSANLAASGAAAKRLIEQGAVTWDGQVIKDPHASVLRVGKTRFASISAEGPSAS
jgi:tyrosyl-tRNA synthetase